MFVELCAQDARLRESEALLRATFEDAPIGMARLDRDGPDRRGQPRARARRSAAAERELVGRHARRAHPPGGPRARRDAAPGAAGAASAARYDARSGCCAPTGVRDAGAAASRSVATPTAGADRAASPRSRTSRERKRAERERERSIREQAARVEAEAVAQRLQAIAAHRRRRARAAAARRAARPSCCERITEVLEVDARGDRALPRRTTRHVVVPGRRGVRRRRGGVRARTGRAGPARSCATASRCVIDDVAQAETLGAAPAAARRSTSVARRAAAASRAGIGVLQVGTLSSARSAPQDAGLLQLAADRAALAIERARLYEREHEIAQQLQRALLPDAAAAACRACGSRRATCPAARAPTWAATGTTRSPCPAGGSRSHGRRRGPRRARRGDRWASCAARCARTRSRRRPGRGRSTRLNRFQCSTSTRTAMATVVLLVLDPHDRHACATRTPATRRRSCSTARRAALPRRRAAAPPLGALDDAIYTRRRPSSRRATTVVLYTDGLVERRGRALDEGFARLRDALAAGGAGARGAVRGDPRRGPRRGDVADDVTFVVANGPAARASAGAALPGEPTAWRACARCCAAGCASRRRRAERSHAVTMATNEAVQNAIEHAHRLEPGDVRGGARARRRRRSWSACATAGAGTRARATTGPGAAAHARPHGRGRDRRAAERHDGADAPPSCELGDKDRARFAWSEGKKGGGTWPMVQET